MPTADFRDSFRRMPTFHRKSHRTTNASTPHQAGRHWSAQRNRDVSIDLRGDSAFRRYLLFIKGNAELAEDSQRECEVSRSSAFFTSVHSAFKISACQSQRINQRKGTLRNSESCGSKSRAPSEACFSRCSATPSRRRCQAVAQPRLADGSRRADKRCR